MKPTYNLAEKQQMMRDRVESRPCKDGRSKKAVRLRKRVRLLSEVKPQLPEYVTQRRAARFMVSRAYSRAYIANQLGLKVEEVDEMLERKEYNPSVTFIGPSEGARNALAEMEREKKRDA